jgi:hypothetical protein
MTQTWSGRGLYFDILALVALLLSCVAIGLNIYSYLVAADRGSDQTWRLLVVLSFSLVAFTLSYAWIASRLVRAGVRAAAEKRASPASPSRGE